MNGKFILDPCCAGRMMWVDKNHPNVIYGDIRVAAKGHIKESFGHSIQPNILMNFKEIPFKDKSFKLIPFDPPHLLNTNKNSIMWKKFGGLLPETWQHDLKKGFSECWRVLEDYGVLIFKWNDRSIPYKKVLEIIGQQPLFHNTLRKKNTLGSTYWATFMKIPEEEE